MCGIVGAQIRDNSASGRKVIMTAELKSLIVQAGPRALKHLREHGWRPQDVDIVPGAAGGPKGLGLARLDEYVSRRNMLATRYDALLKDLPVQTPFVQAANVSALSSRM